MPKTVKPKGRVKKLENLPKNRKRKVGMCLEKEQLGEFGGSERT